MASFLIILNIVDVQVLLSAAIKMDREQKLLVLFYIADDGKGKR